MTKIAPAFASLLLALSSSATFAQTVAPAATVTTTTTAAPASDPVGISAREGFSISGTDVMVTRNGVTEKLQKEMTLPNGLRVQPNGTVITGDGGTLTIRPGQVLGFDGKFSPPGGAAQTAPSTAVTPTGAVTTTTTALPSAPEVSPAAAKEISSAEADRRAKAAGLAPGENPVK